MKFELKNDYTRINFCFYVEKNLYYNISNKIIIKKDYNIL